MARLVVKSVMLNGAPKLRHLSRPMTLVNINQHVVVNQPLAARGRQYSVEAGVVESPFEGVVVPDETMPEYIWKGLDIWADKAVLTCASSGRSYTYGQAREYTRRFAWTLLSQCELKKGDAVGILLPNLPEYLIVIHGAMEAGIVPTFVNPLYTPDEIVRQFKNAGVKVCITIPQLITVANEVASKLNNYKSTIVVGQDKHDKTTNSLSLLQCLQEAKETPLPTICTDDVAVLPYSSGTTGMPKGVMLTHRNLVSNLEQTCHPDIEDFTKSTKEEQKEVCFTVLPFFHIYGFNGILNCSMTHGLHLLSMPRFVPEEYVACLVKYRPTVLFVVPSLLLFLASHPLVTQEHLSSVIKVVCGAAPASKSLVDKFRTKLGRDNINIRQGFGMTESSPVTLFPPKYAPESKISSCGQLMPLTQARIVDLETSKNLGPNKSGELWVRGPQVMKGYLNNEEATRETVDSEGWLHTGDVAYFDDEKYFYIVDRTKELIKVKGNQVSPTELESLIMELPGIADVAVIGIPDTLAGEVPRAFIVKHPKVEITEVQVDEYISSRVAKYKRLMGGVKFIEAIPRNPSGKILRQQLKVLG